LYCIQQTHSRMPTPTPAKKFKIVKKPMSAATAATAASAATAVPAAATADDNNSFRLIDFHVRETAITNHHQSGSGSGSGSASEPEGESTGDDEGNGRTGGGGNGGAIDTKQFQIQMFGINEQGETCSIFVDDYLPFFYVKVADHWTNTTKSAFIRDLKKNIKSRYYENSIIAEKCEIVEKRKLYGFDGGKNHKFVLLVFKNTTVSCVSSISRKSAHPVGSSFPRKRRG
jgi:hypothetical protein